MSDQLPGNMNEHEPSMEDILASIRELIAEESPLKSSEATSEALSAAQNSSVQGEVAADLLQDFDLDMSPELSDGISDELSSEVSGALPDGLKDTDFEQSQIFGRIIDDEAAIPDITADLGGVDIDDSSTKDFLASAGFDLDEDLTRSESDIDEVLLTETLTDSNIDLPHNDEFAADIFETNIPEADMDANDIDANIASFDENMDLTAKLDDEIKSVAETVPESITESIIGADDDLLNDAKAQDELLSEIFDDIDAIAEGGAVEESLIEESLTGATDVADNEIDFDSIFGDEPIVRPGTVQVDVDKAATATGLAGGALGGALAIGGAAAGLAGLGSSAKTIGDEQGSALDLDISELDISESEDFDLGNVLQEGEAEIDMAALDLSDALQPETDFGDSLDALLPELPSQDDDLAMDMSDLDMTNLDVVEGDAADIIADNINVAEDMTPDDLIDELIEDIIDEGDVSDSVQAQDALIDDGADLIETSALEDLASLDDEALEGLRSSPDADIDLVKSLMADLTDDSFVADEISDEALLQSEAGVEGETDSGELGLALDEELPDIADIISDDGFADALLQGEPENEPESELENAFESADISEDAAESMSGLEALVAASATAAIGTSALLVATDDTDSDMPSASSSVIDKGLDKSEQTDLGSQGIEDVTPHEPAAPTSAAEQEIDNLEDKAMPHIVKKDTVSSAETVEAASGAFASLNKVVEEKTVYSESGPRIGDLVQEALKPMLQEWLDKNLKGIVDRAVAKEIKRISSGK